MAADRPTSQQRRPRGGNSSVTDQGRKSRFSLRQHAGSVIAALLIGLLPAVALAQQVGQATGLPIPRFVSLGSQTVNVREGPGSDYRIQWTFVRIGYPVEVTQEFDNWRRIRDVNGDEGWVLGTLLSSRRNGVVRDAGDGAPIPLRSGPSLSAGVVAQLQPGVMAPIDQCQAGWCRLIETRFTGWIEQDRLWGVYPDEIF